MVAIEIVGDILRHEGYDMARINPTHNRGTRRAAFENALKGNPEAKRVHQILSSISARSLEVSQAGMISMGELNTIIDDIKKSYPIGQGD